MKIGTEEGEGISNKVGTGWGQNGIYDKTKKGFQIPQPKTHDKSNAWDENRTRTALRPRDFKSKKGIFNKPLILGLIPLFI